MVALEREHLLRLAISWLGHTGILVGLSAASVSTTALWLMGTKPSFDLAFVVGLATTASYAIDRIADRRRDGHEQRSRTLARIHAIRVICFVMFAIALGITFAKRNLLVIAALAGMPLAVAWYVLPWLGHLCPPLRRRGIRRIKDIPLVKAFYVSACWVVLAPFAAIFVSLPLDGRIATAALFIYPLLFINAVACDIRDATADAKAHIVTLPNYLGIARTLRLLRWLNAIWAVAFTIAVVLEWLPRIVWALPLQSLLVEVCLSRMGRRETDIEFQGDVVFDAILVVHPILIYVGALATGQME